MGFFDRLGREASKFGSALGGLSGRIAGGIVDIAGDIGGQVAEQLPGFILGQLGGAAPTRTGLPGQPRSGPVFAPSAAPTSRVPFVAGAVPFIGGGGVPVPLNLAMPGGALLPAAAGIAGRVITGLGTLGGLSELGEFFGGGEGDVPMANGVALFRPTATSIRPARVIVVPHPQTGAPTFFGHLGRPLLFSRDLSAARKVDRLARRARRTRRGR